jgi:hypothetical protein
MSCDKYEAWEDGRLGAAEFAVHARSCADCAAAAALDARLDRELEALRQPPAAPGLWKRIERALEREQARAAAATPDLRRARRPFAGLLKRPRLIPALAGAALLALLVLGGARLFKAHHPASQGILASRALAEVERKEKDYADAIRALERQAEPRIEAMDSQLMSLYRDKLAAIDSQIDKCRDALAMNPANAHIRYCLLAALQDKRETLSEALGTFN